MARGSAGRSALSRHLDILESFSAERPYRTLSQICMATDLSASSAHRLVTELVGQGLLERQPDRTYRLGIRLWELASSVPGAVGLRESAAPAVHDLHTAVRQHTQLAVLHGDDVLFLERLSTPGAVVNVTEIGSRFPVHVSAAGLVLLAFTSRDEQERLLALPRARLTSRTLFDDDELRSTLRGIRRSGHMIADGCIHPGVRSIAVPIRSVDNDGVVAAVSVVVPVNDTRTVYQLARLRTAAVQISGALRQAYSLGDSAATRSSRGYTTLVRSGLQRVRADPEHNPFASKEIAMAALFNGA